MVQFTVTNLNDSGAGSLRQAIADANALSGKDEIIFEDSLSGGEITLISGELTVSDEVQIQGLGAEDLAISGNNNSPVFVIDDGTDDLIEVEITGLTLTEGIDRETPTDFGAIIDAGAGIDNLEQLTLSDSIITGSDGTAIDNAGTLYLNNSIVEDNNTVGTPGISNGGTAIIVGSTIRNNFTPTSSGIISNGGILTLEDSLVADNNGFGISNFNFDNTAVTTVNNSTIENNNSGGIDNFSFSRTFPDNPSGDNLVIVNDSTIRGNSQEGGISNSGAAVEINNSIVTGNVSEFEGGGINNSGEAILTVNGSTITDNVAGGDFNSSGGGISNTANPGSAGGTPTLNITNSTISGNRAYSGGGIYNRSGNLTISNSTVSDNTTSRYGGEGGGIYNSNYSYSSYSPYSDYSEVKTAEIIKTTITGNSSSYGGGISTRGDLVITDSVVSGNTSNYSGGGINNYSELTISNSAIADNSAGYSGGGINNNFDSDLEVIQSTITGNSATNGGAIFNFGYQSNYSSGSNATILNSTITDNSASESGSGITNNGEAIEVSSTIIAQNEGDRDIAGSSFTSNGNNLIGNGDGASGFSDGVNGDFVGTAANPIDPLLGTLQDNGGSTPTIALLNGSPAINAGSNPLSLETDQRGEGFARVRGGQADIGAFEANAETNPPNGDEGVLIIGTNGRDSLVGGVGNDTIDGGNGRDTLFGAGGNDELFGGRGRDSLVGNNGSDTLRGGNGFDSLNGSAGNDELFGDSGGDFLVGGSGNDFIDGGNGSDTLVGGLGEDRFVIRQQNGVDNIIDYNDGTDLLVLADGLSFDRLKIVEGNSSTEIRLAESDRLLTKISFVSAEVIDESDFVTS